MFCEDAILTIPVAFGDRSHGQVLDHEADCSRPSKAPLQSLRASSPRALLRVLGASALSAAGSSAPRAPRSPGRRIRGGLPHDAGAMDPYGSGGCESRLAAKRKKRPSRRATRAAQSRVCVHTDLAQSTPSSSTHTHTLGQGRGANLARAALRSYGGFGGYTDGFTDPVGGDQYMGDHHSNNQNQGYDPGGGGGGGGNYGNQQQSNAAARQQLLAMGYAGEDVDMALDMAPDMEQARTPAIGPIARGMRARESRVWRSPCRVRCGTRSECVRNCAAHETTAALTRPTWRARRR